MRYLSDLEPDECATIQGVAGNGALRRRLLDMGMVPGAEIEVVRVAPLGDPVEYMVKGYRLSLRRTEAANVMIEELPCQEGPQRKCDCPERPRGRQHGRGRRRGRHRGQGRGWLNRIRAGPEGDDR